MITILAADDDPEVAINIVPISSSGTITEDYQVRVQISLDSPKPIEAVYCQCKGYAFRLTCRHLKAAEYITRAQIAALGVTL